MADMNEGTAYTIIAISLIVIAACWLVVLAGLCLAAWLAAKRVRSITRSFQPPIDQATELLRTATGIAQAVKMGTEEISEVLRDLALDFSARAKRTSALAEEAVSAPIITFTSLMSGLSKAVEKLKKKSETDD